MLTYCFLEQKDLHIFTSSYNELSDQMRFDIYRLRKKSFIDRRKWTIPSYNGNEYEFDIIDDKYSYYTCIYLKDKLMGCVRLRSLNNKNTLTKSLIQHFPSIVLENYIHKNNWETTRFTIDKSFKLDLDKKIPKSYILFSSMIEFSKEFNIKKYIVIVDRLMLNIIRRAGWQFEIHSHGTGCKKDIIYFLVLLPNSNINFKLY